jgi:hypothetical protein
MCRRMIINAGLERVILLDKEGIKEFNPSDWLVEELDLQQKGY